MSILPAVNGFPAGDSFLNNFHLSPFFSLARLSKFLQISLELELTWIGAHISTMPPHPADQQPEHISISPLLQRLAYPATQIPVEATEIASAFALIFEDRLSAIQTAALLTLLHSTGKDKEPSVIAQCSHRMREAACQVDKSTLKQVIKARGKKEGDYRGGLVSFSQRIEPFKMVRFSDRFGELSSVTLSALAEIRIPPLTSLPLPLLSRRRSS